jgi:hypothetical protein
MNKTYADQCLERAEKATEAPWRSYDIFGPDYGEVYGPNVATEKLILGSAADAEFIAHARTDVPELASRLNYVCAILSQIENALRRDMPVHPDYIKEIRQELEAAPILSD